MQLSVVVATYNRRHLLAQTLPTLLNQDYPKSNYEIVLVVDGSVDGTADYARTLQAPCALEVVEQENRGPAAARNTGIGAASGEVVLFIDDDVRCSERLLREHAEAHRSGGVPLRVHGSIHLAPESPLTLASWSTCEWYRRYDAALRSLSSNPNWWPYLNVNGSIRIDSLRELGGFDEAVPFPREDFELAWRMVEAGLRFEYRPRAAAYEVFIKSSRSYVRDARGFGAAEIYIARKHPRYRPHSMLTPLDRERHTALRTLARRSLPSLPSGSEAVLTPAVDGAEKLIRRPRAQRWGALLLELQHRMLLVRSARDTVGNARVLRTEFDRWLPVLLYHHVGPDPHGLPTWLTLMPKVFERQIAWLARRGFSAIGPSDWLAWREGRGQLPPKPVLITFDDAYAEIATHALPVLKQHGFSALVFVVTGSMSGVNAWDAFPLGGARPALMSPSDVAIWARHGVDFGAHGRTHTDLRSLSGRELESEVRGSRQDLEALVDTPIRCFAYPYGLYDDASRNVVAATYDLAFTAEEGINGLRTDPYRLRRTAPYPNDTLLDVECRVRLGRIPLARARDVVQLRTRTRKLAEAIIQPAAPHGSDVPLDQAAETI